jgi:DNA transformation protein
MGQVDDGFILHISELLQPWSVISPRRMFGGWGLYRGALMFALVAEDVLYVKNGSALKDVAGTRELQPFTYEKPVAKGKKKKIVMSYAAVPADVLEDGALLCRWAEAAFQDALSGRRLAATPKRKSALKKR